MGNVPDEAAVGSPMEVDENSDGPNPPTTETGPGRRVKLDKDIILYIIRLACQLRLRDTLMLKNDNTRRRLVETHLHDPGFMEVAVSIDRMLLTSVDPANKHYELLKRIAIRPITKCLRAMPFEVLPADPKVHLGDQPRRWQLRLGHLPERLVCIRLVGTYLIQKRPTAPDEWVEDFHAMLPRVERSIYLASSSLEDYTNPETIPQRVTALFEKIANLAENVPASPSLQWLEASAVPNDPESEAD